MYWLDLYSFASVERLFSSLSPSLAVTGLSFLTKVPLGLPLEYIISDKLADCYKLGNETVSTRHLSLLIWTHKV